MVILFLAFCSIPHFSFLIPFLLIYNLSQGLSLLILLKFRALQIGSQFNNASI